VDLSGEFLGDLPQYVVPEELDCAVVCLECIVECEFVVVEAEIDTSPSDLVDLPCEVDEVLDHLHGGDCTVLVFEECFFEHLGEGSGLNEVLPGPGLDVVLEEPSEEFDGEVLLGYGPDLFQEFIGEEGDVGLPETCCVEEVDHGAGGECSGDDLTYGGLHLIEAHGLLCGAGLGQGGLDGLVVGDLIPQCECSVEGNGEGEGLGDLVHRRDPSVLSVILPEDVFDYGRELEEPLLGCEVEEGLPVEAVEEVPADLDLPLEDLEGCVLVDADLSLALAFGVGGHGLLEVLCEADIVHNEASGLVVEDTIDPCYGLHEPVVLHGLVEVHCVEAWGIESGEPHVTNDDHLELGFGGLEVGGEVIAAALVTDVLLPFHGIGGGAGHDDLEESFLVVVAVPCRADADDFVVEVHADPSRHADHHGLAVHGVEAFLEVVHEVTGDDLHSLFGAHNGLELCPLGLELFPDLFFLSLGDLLEVLVDVGLFVLVE